MPVTINYNFKTRFAVQAAKAYKWSTEYRSGLEDHALMGDETCSRQIQQITDNTLILTDTFLTESGAVEKQKLVKLYPDSLSWNSTHISGPAKYSQFLYRITADGENSSHLDFTGTFLDWSNEKLTETEKASISLRLCKEDANAWKLLAKAMKKELTP